MLAFRERGLHALAQGLQARAEIALDDRAVLAYFDQFVRQVERGDDMLQKFGFFSSDATMPMEDLDPAFFNLPGQLKLDAKSRRVWIGNQELDPPLSAAQFRLLLCLYEQSGKVISRNELILKTWDEEESVGVSEQALDALIRRLRDRLAEINPSHQYIVTVRGHGSRLDNI